jgi:hypothetical protein
MSKMKDYLIAVEEAIEKADAEMNNVGQPTYSDLVDMLRTADRYIAMYHNEPGHDTASRGMTSLIHKLIDKLPGE